MFPLTINAFFEGKVCTTVSLWVRLDDFSPNILVKKFFIIVIDNDGRLLRYNDFNIPPDCNLTARGILNNVTITVESLLRGQGSTPVELTNAISILM